MKVRLFFLLFFISCTVFSVTSTDNFSYICSGNVSNSDKKEEVLLSGTLETGMIKSLGIIPFDVWKCSTSIEISYLSDLSNIDVEIKDETGQSVYHSQVNPVSGGQLLIDTSGWAEGIYTITFANDKGGYVYGTFAI